MKITKTNDIHLAVLTLAELRERPLWRQYDIFKAANEGKLGLYYKLSNAEGYLERKTYISINEHFNSLTNNKYIKEPENQLELDSYLALKNKLDEFAKNNAFLLSHESDEYVRLATETEIEILSACQSGSINYFKKKSGLDPQELYNYFGFVLLHLNHDIPTTLIISPAYSFPKRIKRIIESDLVVFTNQIEAFEQKVFAQHQEKDILANKAFMSAHGKKNV